MRVLRPLGVVLVIVVAVGLWVLFGQIAHDQRQDWDVIDKGLAWTMQFLGLLSTLLGLLGLGRPLLAGRSAGDAARVGFSTVAVLAGITLLGVGSWGAPLALSGVVVGGGTLRYLARKHGKDTDAAA